MQKVPISRAVSLPNGSRASDRKNSTPQLRQETTALRDFEPAYDRCGSWLCENSSARRARRNISKKLRNTKSNHAGCAMLDTLLENCIFYISPMYEVLHSQGHKPSCCHVGAMSGLPESGHGWAIYEAPP